MSEKDPIDLNAILAPHLPGYEPRGGQAQMSEEVDRALGWKKHLICEAGTGTGKSLAYLVPLVNHTVNGEFRAVVSTYTKALQRQLTEKDLPFIKSKIEPNLRFALAFGSENYLCLRRFERAKAQDDLFRDNSEALEDLLFWAGQTKDGLREGSGGPLWNDVMRESDNCHGRDCREFMRCFYQKSRERLRQSHIIIVNHHLYFANMATGGHLLPKFESAIFDEAHEIEDVAADYLGVEFSNLRLNHLFNSVLSKRGKGILKRLKWLEPVEADNVRTLLSSAQRKSAEFFRAFSAQYPEGTARIKETGALKDVVSESILALSMELKGIAGSCSNDEQKRDILAIVRRSEALAGAVRAILNQELEGHVYWAENSGRRYLGLVATPIDVGSLKVFSELESAVYTSATLATGGNFDFVRERLGLYDAEALLLPSPFNYKEQARLYIGADIPPPNTPEFEPAVIKRIQEILEITRGRTLVLFTSHSLLRRAAQEVNVEGVEILRQGEADSYALVEELRAQGGREGIALFGTNTFWQGIDVVGDALKSVVIVRLPFAVPDEPVAEARMELLERLGRDPFNEYTLPRAAITLKQGFGRLIRSSTDTGTVFILDSRIATRQYGKYFMDSLPKIKIVTELEDIKG
jgi:ATP-dependent DNA helicase DinG